MEICFTRDMFHEIYVSLDICFTRYMFHKICFTRDMFHKVCFTMARHRPVVTHVTEAKCNDIGCRMLCNVECYGSVIARKP